MTLCLSAHENQAGLAQNNREQVVKIVSDSARQLPYGFHFVGLPELLFACAQSGFGCTAFGNILNQRRNTHYASFRIDQRCVVPFATNLPTCPRKIVGCDAGPPCLPYDGGPYFVQSLPKVFRRYETRRVTADRGLLVICEDCLSRWVPFGDLKIQIPFNHGKRRLTKVKRKLLLGSSQRFFSQYALRDVSNDNDDLVLAKRLQSGLKERFALHL